MKRTPEKTITVWITKFALTRGIMKARVSVVSGDEAKPFITGGPGSGLFTKHYEITREAAVKSAQAMCARKLASLKKQEAKLKAMTFATDALTPRTYNVRDNDEE